MGRGKGNRDASDPLHHTHFHSASSMQHSEETGSIITPSRRFSGPSPHLDSNLGAGQMCQIHHCKVPLPQLH